jgi:polyisoprenoid-binding protein YceI
VNLDGKDPVKSSLVFNIYPAGTHPPAVNPNGKLEIDGLSDVANYTLLSFHSRRARLSRDGKLELTGGLTLTHVERAATLMWSEAYAGPVYGDPIIQTVTREVTFVLETPSPADGQAQANKRTAISASATIKEEHFPELQRSIVDTNWPPLVQNERCQMPSTVGEDYHGAVCTGTPLNIRLSREPSLTVGEDYPGSDTLTAPRGDNVMIAVHLELTEEATRGSKNAGN